MQLFGKKVQEHRLEELDYRLGLIEEDIHYLNLILKECMGVAPDNVKKRVMPILEKWVKFDKKFIEKMKNAK